jgi:riboflavin kinase/FMN adenylyltransferase
MQVHFGLGLLRAEWAESIVCIGTFDGVHLGHRFLISHAVREARASERPSVLVTFDRLPAAVLAPERCPASISSLYQNLAGFERLGVSVAVILEFDRALSQTTAEDFLREAIVGRLKAAELVVGHDFAFGRGREGTSDWLQGRIKTHAAPPFELDGRRVSSSDIRAAVADGRMEDAARMLGRPFEVGGVVVPGEKLGRSLGFPTINVARSFEQVMPLDGVYGGFCRTPAGVFAAAINIGLRPAVGGLNRTIEAYLLDYTGEDLYGCAVALSVAHRLREERRFPSLEALREQMARDVDEVRRSGIGEQGNEDRNRLGGLADGFGGRPSGPVL